MSRFFSGFSPLEKSVKNDFGVAAGARGDRLGP
jgi:hypothetical protein